MSDSFYRAFEEKFRGSRSLIRSRLDIYRAFISPLKQICSDARGLDLGCGRGEWLEVLQEEGIEPLGIDLDEGMLEACRELHLPTMKGDAVAYLTGLPSESQAVISAFHMVEHIPFGQLQLVVSESIRVLKPGGLLIMETPNPENIAVATRDFYLDPTHQRPIPPLLLSFLTEYYGFHRSKILRLQQSTSLEKNNNPSLMDVFAGSSPDYAVIAQKAATYTHLAAFDAAFSEEYGLPLHVLTSRYDAAQIAKVQQAQDKAQLAHDIAQQAEGRAQQAEERAQQAEERAQRAHDIAKQAVEKTQHALDNAQRAEATSIQYLGQLQAVYASSSWRMMAPIRRIAQLLKKIPGLRKLVVIAKNPLAHGILFVQRRPILRKIFTNFFSGLKHNPSTSHSVGKRILNTEEAAKVTISPAQFTQQTDFSPPSTEDILKRIKKELQTHHPEC